MSSAASRSASMAWDGGGRSGLPRPRSMKRAPGASRAAAAAARMRAKYCSGRRSKSGGAGRATARHHGSAMPHTDALLRDQLDHMEATSAWYRERIAGARDLRAIPFTTKEELREGQRAQPPFGPHLCAEPKRLVRLHVTSGTTG